MADELVDGLLDRDREAELARHLGRCPECASAFGETAGVIHLYRRHRTDAVPGTAHYRLRTALDNLWQGAMDTPGSRGGA